jgi:hypothetical protein
MKTKTKINYKIKHITMKKLLILAVLMMLLLNTLEAQVKVNFTLTTPRISGAFFLMDLKATVPAGQTWRVGSSNIRVDLSCTPAGSLTVKADNPAVNANSNISNANGYQAMTTTSVNGGVALGLNILTFNSSGFYVFAPGTYTIGTLRWNLVSACTNTNMTFRIPPSTFPSVVFDSLTALVSGTTYTTTNPTITGNFNYSSEIPSEFKLYENYPNPFNPTTSIKYDIANNSFVKLTVYDITGKELETLVSENLQAGRYEATWSGSNYASGVYFAKIEAGKYSHIIKMLMVK